jgi:hypothetical protein
MFVGVMAHMAALTKRREVSWPVIARIMVEVRGGEYDARDPHWSWRLNAGESGLHPCQLLRRRQAANPSALPIAPALCVLVPPSPITQVQHVATVRATAMLATSFGAAEADDGGELAPIDWIEPAVFARDRHDFL